MLLVQSTLTANCSCVQADQSFVPHHCCNANCSTGPWQPWMEPVIPVLLIGSGSWSSATAHMAKSESFGHLASTRALGYKACLLAMSVIVGHGYACMPRSATAHGADMWSISTSFSYDSYSARRPTHLLNELQY